MDGQREGSALIVEQRQAVRYLTLNGPEVVNAGVFAALEEELARISSDSGTRAVEITGAGDRAFSAGADVDELTGLDPVDRRDLLERAKGSSALWRRLAPA